MKTSDLSTPVLLVDRERLRRNLHRMQERADRERVALRPHVKTHKSPRIATLQTELGARGVTVATVGEAEVFAGAGFDDVRVAFPVVAREKHERLLELMERDVEVSFLVDTLEGASMAAAAYEEAGVRVPVLIKVDVGYGRVGVPWNDPSLPEFAERIASSPAFRPVGILTHAGQSYHGPDPGEPEAEALRRYATLERDRMLAVAGRLARAGLADESLEISVGSTPTASSFVNRRAGAFSVTELRPGTYVFNDLTQAALGSCAVEDCAASVLATVVSRRAGSDGADHCILDVGKKVLTAEKRHGATGHGLLLPPPGRGDEPIPDVELHGLSEEHGWVRAGPGAGLRVGDRVRVVPNHVCVVVNTQDRFCIVDADRVVEAVSVEARGRVR